MTHPRNDLHHAVIHYFAVKFYCGTPQDGSPAEIRVRRALGLLDDAEWLEALQRCAERER